MRVTAFIRKNVSKTAANAKATVYFRVRDVDCDIKAASELTINPAYWSSERQGYKTRVSLVSEDKRIAFDIAVQEIIASISKEYFKGANSDWLKKIIFAYHHPNAYRYQDRECKNVSLTYWLDKYSTDRLKDVKQAGLYRFLIALIKRFEMYQQKVMKHNGFILNIETMTSEDILSLEKYISNEVTYVTLYPEIYKDVIAKVSKQKRDGNYLSGLMRRLRSAFQWCIKQGATQNNPFLRYETPTLVYGTPYYLTLEERNIVYDMDLSDDPALEIHRDMFMFQCLIGCRHGDLVRLTIDNFINGAIEYIPNKTKEKNSRTVRVPLNEKALAILEKFRNRKTKTLFPHNSLGRYNIAIRKILKRANITRSVSVLDPQTHEEIKRPICEIASSHMARRTFVGNLYKQVKDPSLIGSMSGHVDGSRAFARYRTIDDDMKIELVNMIN
jgi:integrase